MSHSRIHKIRQEVGVKILLEMIEDGVFPIENAEKIGETIRSYFIEKDYDHYFIQHGSWYYPDGQYWMRQLPNLRSTLRKDFKIYLCFVRGGGGWFVVEEEQLYKVLMVRNGNSLRTRAISHNYQLEDGKAKFALTGPEAQLKLVYKKRSA